MSDTNGVEACRDCRTADLCAEGGCAVRNSPPERLPGDPRHHGLCSSLDDTMPNYPNCDCGEEPGKTFSPAGADRGAE